eukprot:TRINITY_DN4080_c0_g1_i1.p1 TRINITY_DN4080_c0_g1~~TRINITY_DN4080_c0_g1_i1.p1  ORF type:complete len:486 (+),score=81.57 TRINITY_DN4080_c0_g1_i1:289-1746(+)
MFVTLIIASLVFSIITPPELSRPSIFVAQQLSFLELSRLISIRAFSLHSEEIQQNFFLTRHERDPFDDITHAISEYNSLFQVSENFTQYCDQKQQPSNETHDSHEVISVNITSPNELNKTTEILKTSIFNETIGTFNETTGHSDNVSLDQKRFQMLYVLPIIVAIVIAASNSIVLFNKWTFHESIDVPINSKVKYHNKFPKRFSLVLPRCDANWANFDLMNLQLSPGNTSAPVGSDYFLISYSSPRMETAYFNNVKFIVCNPREESGLKPSISEFFDNFSRCHPDCKCFLGDRTFRHLNLNDDEICIQTIYPIEIKSEIAKEVFSTNKPDDLTGKCFQLSMYMPGLENKNDLFSPLMKQFFITSTFYSAVNEEETKAPAHFYPTPMVVSSIALRQLTSRLIHETESLKLILQAFSECETKKDKNRIREQLQRRFHEILFPTLYSGAIFELLRRIQCQIFENNRVAASTINADILFCCHGNHNNDD